MTREIVIQGDYGAVVFHDGSVKLITEDEFNGMVLAYGNPGITKMQVGGGMYAKSSISKILTMEEYRKEYPQSQPQRRFDNQFLKYGSLEEAAAGTRDGLSSMVRGLRKFVDANPGAHRARAHLDRLVRKREALYGRPA